MRKKPETFDARTYAEWEARAQDLKRDRDRYKAALEEVMGHGCIFCSSTAKKALGVPL